MATVLRVLCCCFVITDRKKIVEIIIFFEIKFSYLKFVDFKAILTPFSDVIRNRCLFKTIAIERQNTERRNYYPPLPNI